MRGPLEGLGSPHPIGETLPAMYQADDFTRRVCAALDDVLSPVLATLDNFAAYLDLATAPNDLLPWLAGWIGMTLDPRQRSERQRELLQAAGRLQGWQGTARGMELAVEAVLGMRAEVLESGGAIWSLVATDPLPGESVPSVVIRVHPGEGQTVDRQRLDAVIDAIKPVHVRHRVQVVEVS